MRIRKIYIMAITLLCAFFLLPTGADAKVKAPKKECHAYVVMDAGSGEVLFGQDYDKKIYPASTAKIMTSIVCLEHGDVNDKIKTEYDVVYGTTPGTYVLGIGAGVTYTFKDLMSISLISSAADATDSLAVGVFGSKSACVDAMNAKCKELGLTSTHFDNPVGSDIGAGYNETYSTAREMALITRYAMTKQEIRDVVRKSSYSAKDVTCNTTNWFLRGMAWYDEDKYQIIGTKSGTTNAAGHVFIATAKDKKGHEVICAYFGNVSKESTFSSIRSLLDYTFEQYKKGKLTLTPSNYDVRCSKSLGDVYTKYAALDVYPGETDGKFHRNRAINRTELGKMIKGIDDLQGDAVVHNFVTDNKKGNVTAARLAMLVQELYPSHLSDEKVAEILADCQNTEGLTDAEKEAYAIFIQAGLNPDKFCKNAKQIITRKEALLFADAFRDYQMQYKMTHYMVGEQTELSELTLPKSEEALAEAEKDTAAEATTVAGADSAAADLVTVHTLASGITKLNDDWTKLLEDYHNQKEAERAQKAAEAEARKVAEEAAEAATATEAGTEAAATEAVTTEAASTETAATTQAASTETAATTQAATTEAAATTQAATTEAATTSAATTEAKK